MCLKYKKPVSYVLLVWVLILTSALNSRVWGAEEKHAHQKEEDYNAGEMILEHVMDSHEWHIATLEDKHITIPLPIILYDKTEKQWHFFMSSKFHHGHESHKGFKINEEGKIVPVKPGTMQQAENLQAPLDFSITKTAAGVFITAIVLLLVFISIARRYKKHPIESPKGLQSLLEPLILFIRDDVARSSIGEKHYERFMPYLLTLFFFIFFANLIGLIPFFPGGANITGNLGVTGVMAIFTFMITTFSGNKHYWKEIFDAPGVPWWLKFPLPLMPIVEIVGMFTKPFVLMVRLFANILAGHIIVLGFISLIFIFGIGNAIAGYGMSVLSMAFAIFINLLELLVAFIQAYVFTLLSALYFGMATEEAH